MARRKSINWLVWFLIFLNLVLGTYWYLNSDLSLMKNNEEQTLTGSESFKELKEYFTDLANRRGGEYAYQVLKQAKIKPGTDMHLLGHVVGEVLYKQKGASGMQYCTQDFRNACSHTIVVGLFSEKGEQALPEIIKACESAPGGKGAYNMCFHGLGHGVLAFTGYDIAKTVSLCSKTNTGKPGGRESIECVGGAIMEIISGGDHDKTLWTKQSKKYLTTDDPLYPCDSALIPSDAKSLCYIYLTPHLFTFAGGTMSHPQDSFEKAFTYCRALTDDSLRDACYGGFGKEFVVLAKERDIRNISKMNESELQRTYDWCTLADSEDGKKYCMWHVLGSLYWGGENPADTSIKFCTLIPQGYRSECMNILKNMVFFYKDGHAREDFCKSLPNEYKKVCEST